MTQAFLPKILLQKEAEVAQMKMENLGSLRETYSFYEHLKTHANQLQIIAEVKKPVPAWATSI